MPEELKQILVSIFKTTLVAIIFTVIVNYITGSDYLRTFITLICVQFALSYIWNSYTQYSLSRLSIIEETQRLEMYESQGLSVQCAFCKSENFIPIRFDDENDFDCTECNKQNSVYVDVTTAQKTTVGGDSTAEIKKIFEDKLK